MDVSWFSNLKNLKTKSAVRLKRPNGDLSIKTAVDHLCQQRLSANGNSREPESGGNNPNDRRDCQRVEAINWGTESSDISSASSRPIHPNRLIQTDLSQQIRTS